MKKLMVNELKEMLENKEMDFLELDNKMVQSGYHSVFDDGATADIKEDKNVVYTAIDTNECEIIINFEITIDNGEDEVDESFELKVISVEEF
ncbi:hypothetical protein [Clostridium sp. M14]|uniref:hypothetical protein n=1 Tax=Clostridium sp. M14 TaxID=2716311 RepID=UPI0013EE548C|nr:hypothetical protein [Clostridium sp. M14]MBZ9693376.1 hypothetical protein [Clostridium sp. M14]